MPYIAFLDMVGSRMAATISSKEYTQAIKDFSNALIDISSKYDCNIYGYSDNAYIQIEKLDEMISFFKELRQQLLLNHRYFSAAIDEGQLQSKNIHIGKRNGSFMMFTDSKVIDIYLAQCKFTGIGYFLSSKVIERLKNNQMNNAFCPSIYQSFVDSTTDSFTSLVDMSYELVNIEQLSYIISDYITTTILDKRAGRYYLTPIITMIKCLNESVIKHRVHELIDLITFKALPESFKNEGYNTKYPLLFLFALIDYILSRSKSFDSQAICSTVIKESNFPPQDLVKELSQIPTEVISNINKREFIQILYNSEIYNKLG